MRAIFYYMQVVMFGACLTLAACGGSSGGGATSTAITVSGVAAAGTPVNGIVFLQDSSSPAKVLSTAIAADGSFSFDVTNLKTPFLLKAEGTSGGGSVTLCSFASAPGVANINPLSNLAVVLANGGTDPTCLYNNPDQAKMQAILSALPTSINAVQTALNPLLSQYETSSVNFVSDTYSANHLGIDRMFDTVSVAVNNGVVTITNTATNATIFSSTLSNNTLSGQINTNNLPTLPRISGKVATVTGVAIPGVIITATGSRITTTTTDVDGNYSIAGVTNGGYTLNASLAGYTFNPPTLTVTINNENVTGQSFIGTTKAPPTAFKYFSYVANWGSKNISAYSIDATSGALAEIPGSPFAIGTMPSSMTVSPSGKFIYIVGGGNIYGYIIDNSSGALTPIPGSPFAADSPSSLALGPSGKFAYVTNNDSNNITAYSVNSTTGALTAISGGSIYRLRPWSITVAPSGRFAYSASNYLFAYSINADAGLLTETDGNPFSDSASVVTVSPSGKFAYTISYGSNIVSAYSIDATTGALTKIPGSPFAAGESTLSITVDPSSKFAYVVNSNTDNVSAYSINSNTGELKEIPGSPFATGSRPGSISIEPSGKFAYVTNNFSSNVSAYSINTNTGALTAVTGNPFAAGLYPSSIVTVKKVI